MGGSKRDDPAACTTTACMQRGIYGNSRDAQACVVVYCRYAAFRQTAAERQYSGKLRRVTTAGGGGVLGDSAMLFITCRMEDFEEVKHVDGKLFIAGVPPYRN